MWRTRNISDPLSWRAWDGEDFTIASVNPYASPGGLNCSSGQGTTQLGSWSWSDVCGCWIAIGYAAPPGAGPDWRGFSYSTSTDLHSWSDAVELTSGNGGADNYPTLLDLDYAHAGRNYVCSGPSPALFYRRMDPNNLGATTYALPLRVDAVPGASPALGPAPPASCASASSKERRP